MSCPDWQRLDPAERQEASPGGARWEAALRHLDSGCSLCRRDALKADPTLVFRRLPALDMAPAQEVDEVAAARLAVAAMRAASRLEGHGRSNDRQGAARQPARSQRSFDSFRSFRWLRSVRTPRAAQAARWGLAASLAGMALIFGASHSWNGAAGRVALLRTGAPHAATATITTATAGLGGGARPGVVPVASSSRGSIEGLSRPEARVYQIDGPQMSVVMIVDAKLDV
jgi:hypothetical protein